MLSCYINNKEGHR